MASACSTLRKITGTSTVSVDDAIDRALVVARDTCGEPDWFEVETARGFISEGRVTHYQVSLQLGYERSDNSPEKDPYLNSVLSTRRYPTVRPTIERRF